MTPVGVFFCWQGGAERDFVNSTIFETNFRWIDFSDLSGKLHNAIDLPNLASGMTTPQRTCVYYIGPMLPAVEISKLAVYLAEPSFQFDVHT